MREIKDSENSDNKDAVVDIDIDQKEDKNSEKSESSRKDKKRKHIRYEKYIGCINDAKLMQIKNTEKPFLSLFKIMPTEGEIEKYIKL